jgi:beta-alanine degradation protein BauB
MLNTSTIPPRLWASAIVLSITTFAASVEVAAQDLPRSFVASPDVYKVIAENQQYRVIDVRWKPGQRDRLHSHPASAVYYLTDCSVRIHAQDGTSRDANPRAGYAIVQPPILGHVLENIGTTDCKLIMFEPQ